MELATAGVLNAPPPNMNPNAGSSKEDDRGTVYSRQSAVIMNQMRMGSMYGYPSSSSVIGPIGGSHPNQYLSSRPGTPNTMVHGAGYVDNRYSIAVTQTNNALHPYGVQAQAHSMAAFQQPEGTIGAGAGSVYGGMPGRSLSPVIIAGRPHTIMAASDTAHMSGTYMGHQQPVSSEYIAATAAAGNMTMNGSGGFPDMLQRAYSSFPAAPASVISESQTQKPPTPMHLAGIPSDAQIVKAIRGILATSDLTSMTKKKIRQQLASDFGADLSSRKDFISDVIDRMLTGSL
ncbi:hypothetical protein LPJ64_006167 [Coemansia asiatica]|uniref:DEK-C domain-containing protein n=1 Tax=Coemansia asiatica TaxID=1052880 RepID=A0A9W7XFL6_9FUNG|nr:hypothetical protein LPJ64_006167 [Coemansia asiatica]